MDLPLLLSLTLSVLIVVLPACCCKNKKGDMPESVKTEQTAQSPDKDRTINKF